MVMDAMAAIALATETPNPTSLKQRRNQGETVFT